ncbi:MAG TPA: hypothetical protein VM513_16580 [Kofleriaceae bacterium]|jgi:hypothetical protein|nr:hypothetical protein [Kofleriaceae bacterium]
MLRFVAISLWVTAAACAGTYANDSNDAGDVEPVSAERAVTDLPIDGPVSGLPGYAITVMRDTSYCGEKKLVVTLPPQRSTAEPALVSMLELQFPSGLSFDPSPEAAAVREASMQRFTAFVEQLTAAGGAARAVYAPQMNGDDEPAFAAAARLAQAQLHAARLVRYAEIPVNVRTSDYAADTTKAFCDKLSEVSEPLFAAARPAFDRCRAGATRFPDAWWTSVCTSP